MQQEHRECIEQCYECAAACDIVCVKITSK